MTYINHAACYPLGHHGLRYLNFPSIYIYYIGRSRVRFPMVLLEFFIYIILPAALWPWGWLNLQQKWITGIFSGG